MKPLLLLAAALLLGSPAPIPQPAPLRYDLAAAQNWCLAEGAPPCGAITLGGEPAPPLTAAIAPTVRPVTEGVRLVVSLPAQRVYVFDDGDFIASAPVSTGKRGHGTPAGTFRILEKQIRHRSNKYSNAPMPFMQRLTMSGVALHAGHLPGYPASHGCIRLSQSFARRLYRLTDLHTTVTITRSRPKKAAEALDFAQPI